MINPKHKLPKNTLPCLCGRSNLEVVYIFKHTKGRRHKKYYAIGCSDFSCWQGATATTVQAAVNKWNKVMEKVNE